MRDPDVHKRHGGLGRLLGALGNSISGLRQAWHVETAFRQELIACAVLAPVALVAPVTALERVMLLGSLLLVLIVELLNSAIEAVVDRVSLEIHPLSKRAKDTASAAVLLSLLLAGATWATIWLSVAARTD